MLKKIVVKGAKEHNLKNLSVEIPRDQFVVITGLSGSGKSSLAFDTIYAEGQRRYVESLSSYARQFLDRMKKPNVDLIEGNGGATLPAVMVFAIDLLVQQTPARQKQQFTTSGFINGQMYNQGFI